MIKSTANNNTASGSFPRLMINIEGVIILATSENEDKSVRGFVLFATKHENEIGLHLNSWTGFKDYVGTLTLENL